jgi:hypothetical protein
MEAIVSFKIPEFHSVGTKKIFVKNGAGNNSEETFKNILKSLSKTLTKNWESIEFDFNCSTFLVCRHWLIETNFDWYNSCQIKP